MIELKDFTGKPCRTKSAFEFLPKQRLELDLEKTALTLRSEGIFVEAETPFVLMLKSGDFSVSFFRSGKILVKNVQEELKARQIAETIVNAVNKSL